VGPASGKQVGSISPGWGCGIAWRPDGQQIALAGGAFAQGVMIYDRAGRNQVAALSESPTGGYEEVFSVSWSPDGRWLAVGCGNGGIRVWDMTTRKPLWNKRYGNGTVVVAWKPNGTALAAADSFGSVLLIGAMDGRVTRHLQSGRDEYAYGVFSPIAWSPDGKRIAAPGGQDSTVRIWDAATGQVLQTLTTPVYVAGSLTWNRDGKHLAGHAGDAVWIWDVVTGQRKPVISGSIHLYSAAWSPDGKTLAVGAADGSVRLSSIAAGGGAGTGKRR
jgi:WD40 repeat protein